MKALKSMRDLLVVEEMAKTKKRAPRSVEVNAVRVVLFDFQAAKEYPEQVTVLAGDLVYVFEAFPDGWCEVKTKNNRIGVIPTAYHGEIALPSSEKPRLELHADQPLKLVDGTASLTKRERIKRQATGLRRMAQDKLIQKMDEFAQGTRRALGALVFNVVIPLGQHAYRLASKNESKSTLLSALARNAFQSVTLALVPMLTEHELAAFSIRLQEDAARVKAEKMHRHTTNQEASRVRSADSRTMMSQQEAVATKEE